MITYVEHDEKRRKLHGSKSKVSTVFISKLSLDILLKIEKKVRFYRNDFRASAAVMRAPPCFRAPTKTWKASVIYI